MKILPVVVDVFHADRQTEGRTNMTKLIVIERNLANASNKTDKLFYLLMPNINYSGRTAPLTSKVAFYIFSQEIYVLNILIIVDILRFFLFKMQFVS